MNTKMSIYFYNISLSCCCCCCWWRWLVYI